MLISEIFTSIKKLAEDDQSIQDTDLTTWVDMGIQRINQAMKCEIAPIKGAATSTEPDFDKRFHESLVLFATAKYHESDSAFGNAQYWMGAFNDMLMTMERDMEIKPSQRRDYQTQQITGTSGTWNYALTMDDGAYYDNLRVYINDVLTTLYTVDFTNRLLKINPSVTITTGDKITVMFENNSDLNQPPYQWWTNW